MKKFTKDDVGIYIRNVKNINFFRDNMITLLLDHFNTGKHTITSQIISKLKSGDKNGIFEAINLLNKITENDVLFKLDDNGNLILIEKNLQNKKGNIMKKKVKVADIKLTPKAKNVIKAFIEKQPAECKLLQTDGNILNGNWMGGSKIAYWKNNKIVTSDLDSRSKQTVINALKKTAPNNIFASVGKKLLSVVEKLEKDAGKKKKKDKNPTINGAQLDELSRNYKEAKNALNAAKQGFMQAKKAFEEGRALWDQLNSIMEEE